jgi:hypothetical protein
MKRLIMLFLCVFLLAGSAQALTIERMELYGGNGATFDDWLSNRNAWSTSNLGWYVLGVSSAAGGPLLNAPDTTITGLPFGNYYLYATPGALGDHPQLQVYLSDDPNYPIAAIFELSGTPGVATTWTRTAGAGNISLGWASGTADLVNGPSMGPGGGDDFYLKVGISNPVPLPGAVWLLGSGLVGLAGLRRRFGR